MLISPPFLPPRLAEDDDAYLETAMRSPEHGNFPVSHKLSWHGGLHLEAPARDKGREPVRAIADGIIAYVRQPTARPATAAEDEQHVLGYSRCDIDALRKMLDEDGDGITTRSEAENRLKDAEVQRTMRGMVCKFPTEWQRSGIAERWNWLTQEGPDRETSATPSLNDSTYLSQADFPEFQRYVEALAFWELAALDDIGSAHWHFHPRKFIEHFRKCGWLSIEEMKHIYADKESVYKDVGQSGDTVKEKFRLGLNLVFRKYLLNTPVRMAHFFGQAAQESFLFMATREVAINVSNAIRENHISAQGEERGYLQITPANRNQLLFFAERGRKGYYERRTDLGNTDKHRDSAPPRPRHYCLR
ncbi:hypothetical protein [uncultured Herbaspirillum sp.]|uniref:hypothetical protein n=1 Tax=uncultured Herbaspirillum sp. TaxID=160236 RepID=UPI002590A486|nr:hypothetical protein [uncultured Herbaspirillum sp.]